MKIESVVPVSASSDTKKINSSSSSVYTLFKDVLNEERSPIESKETSSFDTPEDESKDEKLLEEMAGALFSGFIPIQEKVGHLVGSEVSSSLLSEDVKLSEVAEAIKPLSGESMMNLMNQTNNSKIDLASIDSSKVALPETAVIKTMEIAKVDSAVMSSVLSAVPESDESKVGSSNTLIQVTSSHGEVTKNWLTKLLAQTTASSGTNEAVVHSKNVLEGELSISQVLLGVRQFSGTIQPISNSNSPELNLDVKTQELSVEEVQLVQGSLEGQVESAISNVPVGQAQVIVEGSSNLITSTEKNYQAAPIWQNQSEIIDKLVQQASLMKEGDSTKLALKLAPHHLGNIQIELELMDGKLQGRIVTETQEVSQYLEKALQSLAPDVLSVKALQIETQPSFNSSFTQSQKQNQQEKETSKTTFYHLDEEEDGVGESVIDGKVYLVV